MVVISMEAKDKKGKVIHSLQDSCILTSIKFQVNKFILILKGDTEHGL